MASNHTGDMVNGQFGRPARGMGFGLGVQIVLDPVAADLRRPRARADGPAGTAPTSTSSPRSRWSRIFMMQTGAGAMPRDFENAVWQAIVE